ncbi:hypothetical protein Tco_1310421 [Tanacetum coccineum]
MKAVPEPDPEKEVAAMGPQVNKRRRKRGNDGADANALPKVLRKDHVALIPAQSTLEGKSLAAIGLDVGSTLPRPEQDVPNLLERRPLRSPPKMLLPHRRKTCSPWRVRDQGNQLLSHTWSGLWGYLSARVGHDQQLPPGHPGRVLGCGRPHMAMGSQLRLRFEQEARNFESLLEAEFADLQVSNNQLSKQVSTLQTQVTGKERIKSAFEEFKKYENNRVSSQCAEMDARLDALSIDFKEKLHPHMLTAIAGRRWVIGHGLRLAIMKCADSTELRQVFANVVSTGIAKGMSEQLKHGIEHRKANLDLAAIEAYDPEADTKYVAALHALKDLKYPLFNQLGKLKDAPIELIMASLYLESDSG